MISYMISYMEVVHFMKFGRSMGSNEVRPLARLPSRIADFRPHLKADGVGPRISLIYKAQAQAQTRGNRELAKNIIKLFAMAVGRIW